MAERLLNMFPEVSTMEEARTMVQGYVGEEMLSTSETRVESFFMGLPDTTAVIEILNGNSTAMAKKTAATDWQTKCLRLMAPRVMSLYMLGRKFVFSCCEEIMNNRYDEITGLAMNSNTPDCTLANLATYGNAVTTFRTRLNDLLQYDCFSTVPDSIAGEYTIEQNNLVNITGILNEIKAQRRMQLGGSIVRKDGIALPSHASEYEAFFDGFLAMPNARLTKTNKAGKLLVATALVSYLNMKGINVNTFEAGNPRITGSIPNWALVKQHVNELMANNGAAAVNRNEAYAQQIANIDTLFLTYLWLRISGVITMNGNQPNAASLAKLLTMNATLYAMGSKVMGATVLERNYFENATGPMATIKQYMNNTGSIHQPPYAMNMHRLTHMVATFGGLYLPNIGRSLYTMGVSTLYITSLKLESGAGARFIVAWNIIQKIIAPLYPGAREGILANAGALHALHQLFLRKPTCMAKSVGMEGRIDDIILRGIEGADRAVQPSMADIVAFSNNANLRTLMGVNMAQDELDARRTRVRNMLGIPLVQV